MSGSRTASVVVALVAIGLGAVAGGAGCKGRGTGKGDGSGGGSGGGGGTGARDGGAGVGHDARSPGAGDTVVRVVVDGVDFVLVDAPRVAIWPELRELVMAGTPAQETWWSIEVRGATTRTFEAPGRTHAGLVPVLYPEAGVSFGFFDPATLVDRGRPRISVAGVTDVVITTHDPAHPVARDAGAGLTSGPGSGIGPGLGGGGAGGTEHGGERVDEPRPVPDASLTVTVTSPAGRKVIDGTRLAALEAVHAPAGDTETPGWDLLDVLAAAGVPPRGTFRLRDREGAIVEIPATDLTPDLGLAFLKLNRSGVLRFRLFRKVAGTWEVTGELRGVFAIDVVP